MKKFSLILAVVALFASSANAQTPSTKAAVAPAAKAPTEVATPTDASKEATKVEKKAVKATKKAKKAQAEVAPTEAKAVNKGEVVPAVQAVQAVPAPAPAPAVKK